MISHLARPSSQEILRAELSEPSQCGAGLAYCGTGSAGLRASHFTTYSNPDNFTNLAYSSTTYYMRIQCCCTKFGKIHRSTENHQSFAFKRDFLIKTTPAVAY